jgi:hypothetical protein
MGVVVLKKRINPLTSGGPVSLPIVHPGLPFYGLHCGAPHAEAGYRRPVGAAQDQNVWVRALEAVARGQAQSLGRSCPSD